MTFFSLHWQVDELHSPRPATQLFDASTMVDSGLFGQFARFEYVMKVIDCTTVVVVINDTRIKRRILCGRWEYRFDDHDGRGKRIILSYFLITFGRYYKRNLRNYKIAIKIQGLTSTYIRQQFKKVVFGRPNPGKSAHPLTTHSTPPPPSPFRLNYHGGYSTKKKTSYKICNFFIFFV